MYKTLKRSNGKGSMTRIGCFIIYTFVVISLLPIWNDNIKKIFSFFNLDFILLGLGIFLFICLKFYMEKIWSSYSKNWHALGEEFKILGTEIEKYMPFYVISTIITSIVISFLTKSNPTNQGALEEMFLETPIAMFIIVVFIGPIYEEILFRFLPRQVIKNNLSYILITSLIFGGLHVVGDQQWYYYLPLYSMDSFYFGYRYAKTNDIFVSIALHMFNNFIATILVLISLN